MLSRMVLIAVLTATQTLACNPAFTQTPSPATTAADLYKKASPSVETTTLSLIQNRQLFVSLTRMRTTLWTFWKLISERTSHSSK